MAGLNSLGNVAVSVAIWASATNTVSWKKRYGAGNSSGNAGELSSYYACGF